MNDRKHEDRGREPGGDAAPASPMVALFDEVAIQARERGVELVLAALSHLLQQQTWARERLRAHAGRSVRIAFEVPAGLAPDLHATIDAQGLLRRADPDASADATLLLRPDAQALVSLLREGPQSLSAHLRVEGEVTLAACLGELAQHLRWDAEEDLSRVLGDVAAHRLVGLAGEGFARFLDLGRRVESAAAQFLGAPRGPLAGSPRLAELRREALALEQGLKSLEARAARLVRKRAGQRG